MRVPRVRVTDLGPDTLVLDEAQRHYLTSVLRLRPGATVELFDGRGQAARAELREDGALHVRERLRVEASGREVTIALATPKGDRADWAVEKLTELGVARIVWLTCERSVVTPRDAGKRMERWQRLVAAAAAQARRAHVPALEAPRDFSEALGALTADARYIATFTDQTLRARLDADAPASVIVLVGPEGGFSERELDLARGAGYSAVSLGPHVLRVETAAVASAALLVGA